MSGIELYAGSPDEITPAISGYGYSWYLDPGSFAQDSVSFACRCVGRFYSHTVLQSGGYVALLDEFASMPGFRTPEGPVFLFRFVEAIDEILDYEDIRTLLPALSMGQVAGGVEYLRRLAQFNTAGFDIDRIEQVSQDEELIAELRHSIASGEAVNVFDYR